MPVAEIAQRGVALVITVIMVAVITFMAIAFLVLTRREKGSVTTATDQTIAKFAADTAIERAKADLLAPILAFTNAFAYDLRVSTNYINPFGYDNSQPQQQLDSSVWHYETNVSYSYPNGTPVAGNDLLQNLANLFYDPRPPVFITNRQTGVADFRFYLDLNRNGRYDTNGLLPVINPVGTFYDTNGNVVTAISPTSTGIASNWFVGDPEWIGVLERPDQPHSSSNRFVSRFAWLSVPAGKTLDLNSIHNQAKMRTGAGAQNEDGFLRNMGVGPWELNLAGFLADLNTNIWNTSDSFQQARYSSTPYFYVTNVPPPRMPQPSRGSAFEDAVGLTRFRYASDWTKLQTVGNLFGIAGTNAFARDGVDGYSDGPLMTSTTVVTNDNDFGRCTFGWSGAQTFNQFFTPQDFFDKTKTIPPNSPAATRPRFTDRLLTAGTNTASYDRYTYYRLLSQLGTDSDPEPPDRLNLNWDNLNAYRHPVTGVTAASATNFQPWRALDFFTNAADRLLKRSTADWLASNPQWYWATFATNGPFGITHIPVRVGTNITYMSSVHRLLQLAANICDATVTNRVNRADPRLPVPSVFRPVFQRQGTNVFIVGYTEPPDDPTALFTPPLDLRNSADVAALQPYDNVYGVPWILGARKGLPNFNEFAFQSVFQITRKLQITRPTRNSPVSAYQTNQMYVLSISNVLGAEFWNSYRSNYNRPVEIIVANRMDLALTNSDGLRLTHPNSGIFAVAGNLTLPKPGTNVWAGQTFLVPLRTNLNFPAPCVYRQGTRTINTNLSAPFEIGQGFPLPQWGVAVTNRLVCIIRDAGTRQLLDYVQMNGLDNVRNLNAEMHAQSPAATGWDALWNTNRQGNSTSILTPQYGVIAQVRISMGDYNANNVDWTDYGFQPTGQTKKWAIDNFRAFFRLGPLFNQAVEDNTNLVQEVPFSPSLKLSRYCTWQANDPLVHYTPADLQYFASTNELVKESVKAGVVVQTLENIGRVNDRYEPWGYPPSAPGKDAFNLALKDPLVRSSDDWDFPTNKLPNIGWLGRIHRGTPWQTVYLKSSPIVPISWQKWSGNFEPVDAFHTQPVNDRLILDLFTTAFSDTASRGQLSINQGGLAAWSAVFSGVLAVTNAMTDKDVRQLAVTGASPIYRPRVIDPAGAFLPNNTNTWSPLLFLVDDINRARATNRSGLGVFTNLGDILSAPALTEQSPFLNRGNTMQAQQALSDAAYERLPQQILGLLKVGTPRFVIYGYGQTLRPAPNSVETSGTFAGLCKNYQITAETAVRAVVRVEGSPDVRTVDRNNVFYTDDPLRRYPPRLVVESYNVLPPD